MLVFIPDPVDVDTENVIEPGCLCTLRVCKCLQTRRRTLVDIGLIAARSGEFSLHSYLKLIQRAVATSSEIYAVVPDAFCNVGMTLENFSKYSRIIRQLGAKTVLVLQRFYADLDAYLRVIDDADVVALPARQHCDVKCSVRPRLCAERIERALRTLRQLKPVHLLGPAARVLRLLGETLRDVHSIDTMVYRIAPTERVKRVVGGKRMVTKNAEAVVWLREWLRVARLLR